MAVAVGIEVSEKEGRGRVLLTPGVRYRLEGRGLVASACDQLCPKGSLVIIADGKKLQEPDGVRWVQEWDIFILLCSRHFESGGLGQRVKRGGVEVELMMSYP